MKHQASIFNNNFDRKVEELYADTDEGREIIYKMCVAFDLPMDFKQTKVLKILKIRPYAEIPADRIKKHAAYEDLWMTDFEIAHINGNNDKH